jgi:tetratricopeptide (TPR) repeat protein
MLGRGGQFLCGAATLILLGCSGPQHLEIRAAGSSPLASLAVGTDKLAYADGQLALGQVGLALEAYRVEHRRHPAGVPALLGMAQCYDRMGRYDLSRRHYEAALALAPADSVVLARLAASLDRAGALEEAASVRQEIKRLAAGAITVPLVSEGEVSPITTRKTEVAASQSDRDKGGSRPRLERLSFGEVALITSGGPRWTAAVRAGTPTGTATLRLLNAARSQGLAARTRSLLRGRGWERVVIGDAPAVRKRSLIVYPAKARAAAARLAGELGVGSVQDEQSSEIVLLLGRDLAALKLLYRL